MDLVSLVSFTVVEAPNQPLSLCASARDPNSLALQFQMATGRYPGAQAVAVADVLVCACSFGTVLWEIVTGEQPVRRTTRPVE